MDKRMPIPSGTMKAIRKYLAGHFPENSEDVMQRVLSRYGELEKGQPWIGGKSNVLWDKMYGSIALFAMYEVLPAKPSVEEMTELCTDAFIGNNRTIGRFIDFNWRWLQRLYAAMYVPIKQQSDKHIEDGSWGNTWRYELNPEGRTEGVNVRLCNCPVFDFAKAHGFEHLMPALCASDYKIFEPMHCRMIRYHTIASGDAYCDFWQVGDESQAWADVDKDKLK